MSGLLELRRGTSKGRGWPLWAASVSHRAILRILGFGHAVDVVATCVDLLDPARHVPVCRGCGMFRAFLKKSLARVLGALDFSISQGQTKRVL